MKNTLKTLSILLDYPSKETKKLYEEKDVLYKILSKEDKDIAIKIKEFLEKTDYYSLDEKFVSVFEMPVKCPLYAHEYLIKGKEDEIGEFLLNIKVFYKSKGYDLQVQREIPDYLPVMLEFLSLVYDDKELAKIFSSKYLSPWIKKLQRCLQEENSEYSLLVDSLIMILEKMGQ